MGDFNTTSDKLKRRGYWKVELFPSTFNENVLGKLSDCKKIVSESSVQLRGWDYPHVPTQEDEKQGLYNIDSNRYESWIDWSIYKEVWRFYKSAKFIHLRGLNEHWYDEFKVIFGENPLPRLSPGTVVDAINAVYVLTEMLTFSYNLINRLDSVDSFNLRVTLCNVKDNRLTTLDPSRAPIHAQVNHTVDIKALGVVLSKADTIDKDRMLKLAREASQNIFESFEWHASESLLEEEQKKLLSRRF